MQFFFPLLSGEIYIIIVYTEEPMALTCPTGNPCITLPAGKLPSITSASIGGNYSEATITAFANKFQHHSFISSSIRLCLQSES
jgi:hypothetical protein